jgi:hypothetical protein
MGARGGRQFVNGPGGMRERDPGDAMVSAVRLHAGLSLSALALLAAAVVLRLGGWLSVSDSGSAMPVATIGGALVALGEIVIASIIGRIWFGTVSRSDATLRELHAAFVPRGMLAMLLAGGAVALAAMLLALGAGWSLSLVGLAGLLMLRRQRPDAAHIERLLRRELQSSV